MVVAGHLIVFMIGFLITTPTAYSVSSASVRRATFDKRPLQVTEHTDDRSGQSEKELQQFNFTTLVPPSTSQDPVVTADPLLTAVSVFQGRLRRQAGTNDSEQKLSRIELEYQNPIHIRNSPSALFYENVESNPENTAESMATPGQSNPFVDKPSKSRDTSGHRDRAES